MTSAFDSVGGLRLVRIGIQVDGIFTYFQDIDIRISGQKFASPSSNVCTIKISNLTRAQRNWLLTNASPIIPSSGSSRVPAYVVVDVGRTSYGYFRLYEGYTWVSSVTQPPDIGLTLTSLAQSQLAGLVQSNTQGAITQLEAIAQSVADQCQLDLVFLATPKQVANYRFTGGVTKQIQALQDIGGVRAWEDNGLLYVIDQDAFRESNGFVLSMATGMVGVPVSNQQGCTAKMLVSPLVNLGDKITVNSVLNPSVNGLPFRVSQIGFDITNRDTPFYYDLVLSNNLAILGAT